MHIHTPYELYLYAQDKMTEYEKEAERNRLLAEARAPRGLRRSLALVLYDLADRLAPQISRFNETKLTQSAPKWKEKEDAVTG
jgi:hypothetical protein